jgi:hypothetical protein
MPTDGRKGAGVRPRGAGVNRCPVCGEGPLPEALWQFYDAHTTCQRVSHPRMAPSTHGMIPCG